MLESSLTDLINGGCVWGKLPLKLLNASKSIMMKLKYQPSNCLQDNSDAEAHNTSTSGTVKPDFIT